VQPDLKPYNVMIVHEGTARIIAFGIVCSLRTKELATCGAMVGDEVDARSDICPLGVMVFENGTETFFTPGNCSGSRRTAGWK